MTCTCNRRETHVHRPDEQCGTGLGALFVVSATIVAAGMALGYLLALLGGWSVHA